MPITIKQNKVKFKHPTQQGFIEFNSIAEKSTDQLKEELRDTADEIKASWPQNAQVLTTKVNELVKFQGTQPEISSATQIWVDTSDEVEQIGIPTEEEFNEIKDIIDQKIIKIFPTITQMVEDLTLKNNDTVQTLGYYSVNDNGGALYCICNTIPTTHYEILANGLYAKLIYQEYIIPETLGAYGNGIDNDTEAFRKAISIGGKIVCTPKKTYLIDIDFDVNNDGALLCGLNLLSGTHIDLNGSTLKVNSMLNPSSSAKRTLIYIKNAVDVSIKNGSIVGLIPESNGSEYYHCFNILSSDQICLSDLYIYNFYGDGIILTEYKSTKQATTNVKINKCIIDSVGRNGISIINADNVIISDCIIKNIDRKAPKSGIDIEPNRTYQKATNISIAKCTIENCTSRGILFALSNNPEKILVNIADSFISSSMIGLDITATLTNNEPITTSGSIIVNNTTISDITNIAIKIESTCYELAFKASNIIIMNGQGQSGAVVGSNAALYIRSFAQDSEQNIINMKNIILDNITLLNCNFNYTGYIRAAEVFYRSNVTKSISVGNTTSLKIEQMVDDYIELGATRTIPTGGAGTIAKKYILPSNVNKNCVMTFANLPSDFDIIFVNLSDTYNIIDSNNNVLVPPKSMKIYSCKYNSIF